MGTRLQVILGVFQFVSLTRIPMCCAKVSVRLLSFLLLWCLNTFACDVTRADRTGLTARFGSSCAIGGTVTTCESGVNFTRLPVASPRALTAVVLCVSGYNLKVCTVGH